MQGNLASDIGGPVEYVVIALEPPHRTAGVLDALLDHVENQTVRLLDIALVRRVTHDDFEILEMDADEFQLAGLRLHAPGLVTEDDVAQMCQTVAIGHSVLLALLELLWERRFSETVSRRGAVIAQSGRFTTSTISAALRLAHEQSDAHENRFSA